ncbi:alginate export family protein [Porticoccus sp. GXU_MW_L64]
MKSTSKTLLSVAVAAAVCAFANPTYADDANSLSDAFKNGTVKGNFRLRYEEVDNTSSDGALTLRSRLTFQSAEYKGFSALLEMDDVSHFGSDNFVGIPDPEGSEVNQSWIKYNFGKSDATFGRQRINLDNQRFVGGVGFRQNEQTYDGISYTDKHLKDTTVFVANINNVNRIFGEDSPIGDHDNDSWLVNANYSGFKNGKLSLYAYLLDNSNAALFSTDTYGIRYSGKAGKSFSYNLEYATQSDAANNPLDYSAEYLLLEGSLQTKPVKLTLGYELLGSDNGDTGGSLLNDGRFITPLATLHKFQGWTDMFIAGGTGNIDTGVEDLYFSVSGKAGGFKLVFVYHDFSADKASATVDDLGSEWGFLVGRKINDNLNLSLKYADYSADDFGTDTEKLWLTAQFAF